MAEDKFVDTVRKGLARFFFGPTDSKFSTELRPDVSLGFSSLLRTWRDQYSDLMGISGSRSDKYDQYNYLDKNLAEAAASLNVYADNVVSGTVGGDDSYYVMIDEDESNIDELEEIVEDAEDRTLIKDMIWSIARALNRDGDVFGEVVIGKDTGEEMQLVKLKMLPTKEMIAVVDERGAWKDPKFPYAQVVAGTTLPIPFDWWRIIHFKIGNDIYGVDYSLFANAALRIGRQLIWVDEALVLARLSRAWQRFAYFVDTGKLGPDEALTFVEKFMTRLRTQRSITDKTTGRTTVMDAPLLPDEDVGIPVGDGSKADVKPLSGDTNIGNIRDVEYLQSKFLMATTTPKAYVALEEGVNAKATLGQIDVQFARQVRRRQQSLIPGLRQYYKLIFILSGKDPDSFKWEIVFPELATTDEMIKWEILAIKASIAKILAVDVGVVNNLYIMKELLGFDDDEIQKYAAMTDGDGGDGGDGDMGMGAVQIPPQLAALVRKDPEVRAMLHDLKDLVAARAMRDTLIAGKRKVGIDRKDALIKKD